MKEKIKHEEGKGNYIREGKETILEERRPQEAGK